MGICLTVGSPTDPTFAFHPTSTPTMPAQPQGMPQTLPSLLEKSSKDGHPQHGLQAPVHVTPSLQVLRLTLSKQHANDSIRLCLG